MILMLHNEDNYGITSQAPLLECVDVPLPIYYF